jgi:hypothetical protein
MVNAGIGFNQKELTAPVIGARSALPYQGLLN